MPQVGSPSFLANMAVRRRQLNRVRSALFDLPGVAREGGPPPPVVPAQRPNPQQQAIAQARATEPVGVARPDLSTREGRLAVVGTALESVRQMKTTQALIRHELLPPMTTRDGQLFHTKKMMQLMFPSARVRFP